MTDTTDLTTDDADLLARLVLMRVAAPGDRLIAHLVRDFGAITTAEAILAESTPDLLSSKDDDRFDRAALLNAGPTLAARARAAVPDADLAAGAACGARFITPNSDEEWPERLGDMDTLGDGAPLGLWVVGTHPLPDRQLVAVTGTSVPTPYGSHVAADIASGLAHRGFGVTGFIAGIDKVARRTALIERAPAIVIVPYGVDGFLRRDQTVADGATLISQEPLGTNMQRFRLIDATALLAGFCEAMVVVEAGTRSTAMVSARQAQQFRRRVLAVPGPVTSDRSEGTHQLIRDAGATLVASATDIVEELHEPLYAPA